MTANFVSDICYTFFLLRLRQNVCLKQFECEPRSYMNAWRQLLLPASNTSIPGQWSASIKCNYFSELFHRPNRLKERLQSTIPDLIFKGLKSAKNSLMVYHEDTDLSSALPHSMMTSLTSIEQDTESEEESFNLDCAPYPWLDSTKETFIIQQKV